MVLKKTISEGMSRLTLNIQRFFRLLKDDCIEDSRRIIIQTVGKKHFKKIINYFWKFTNNVKKNLFNSDNKKKTLSFKDSKPIIFISACENEKKSGGYKFNGGIHEYNMLVKILRLHGYEAYIVTFFGDYENWLFEHQPHISIKEFQQKIKSHPNIRCITSWATAEVFLKNCNKIYFWDMELLYTDHAHFSALKKLYKSKIVKTAAISRTIQAWHMANFEKECVLLPNIIDKYYWKPDENKRLSNRVGYILEDDFTNTLINDFKTTTLNLGLNLEFFCVSGNAQEFLEGLQSCNIFLSMNQGKDPLWGEGCPRTIIEALSAGNVVVAFDLIGNREILHNSFNGIIVPRKRYDLMNNALIKLYQNPSEIDRLRWNGQNLLQYCHSFESRWPAIVEFLDLS